MLNTITVDTISNDGAVNPFTWGIVAPDKYVLYAGNANLTQRIKEAGFKLVRVNPIQNMLYHGRDPYPSANTWNFTDIDTILKMIFDAGAQPMFLVCGFPNGVPHTVEPSPSNLIVSADWNAYATFMRGIVKRYNTDKVLGADRTIRYFEMWNEPMNEWDGKFHTFEQLKTFTQTVGNAMKAEDPTIKLSGIVWSHSDFFWSGSEIAMGAKQLEAQLDILSWHDYGFSNGASAGYPQYPDPNAIESDIARMAWTVEHYQNRPRIVEAGGDGAIFVSPTGKHYGAAITEYNMSHQNGGSTYNLKYRNEFNATFIASAIVNAMKGGVDVFSYYCLAETGDNLLGVLDNRTYAPYKPYYTFHLFGNHFGNQKLTATGGSANLEFVASKDTVSGKTYVVVVNKDMSVTYDATINLNNISNASGSVAVWKLDATTNPTSSTTASYASSQFTYSIPPKTVISFEISPIPTPTPLPGSIKYEAENAALNIAKKATDHLNYSGTGFVDNYVTASVGASTTFTVTAASAGVSNVNLRYANATGISRTLSIYVNGVKIKQTTLAKLANWDTWGNQVESLTLNAGINTIAYKYDAGDTANVNLDYISLLGSTPTPTPTPGGNLFSTGFESSDPQPTWLNTIERSQNVSGYISGISPECSPRHESAHTGISALMYSGTDNSTVISYANYKVFNVNIPITANTKLSYWINPQQDNGRYVGIDFIMTDGTTLRDSGAVDYNGYSMHPNAGHGGAILINTWTQIKSNVGQLLTGKTIARITVNYDRPPNTGQYRGYIDDILITNGTLH